MEQLTVIKKRFSVVCGVLILALIVIFSVFAVHCHNVDAYNKETHVITGNGRDDNDVSVDVHERGQSTDTWDKQDAELGVTLKGVIYEATIENDAKNQLTDWTLTVNIDEECFINNAWCGVVEIHQLSGDTEKVQSLNLRNCDHDSIELDHHISGNDIMIELEPGSSFTYYPSSVDNEATVDSESSLNVGVILYSYDTDVDVSDITFQYHMEKGYFENNAGSWLTFALVAWVICLMTCAALMLMAQRYEKRISEKNKQVEEALDVFTKFVDAKDPYTEGHSERVAENARLIAERMGFKQKRCREIYYSALLHDIGKCYVPDEILKKPSRLTDEEFATIKKHTIWGAEMVGNYKSIPEARDAALYHHERYDGKGYPTGRAGEDIPLIGRIICVADSYDAMNSNRVYRKKLSREVIVDELKKNSGTQFDPKIVDIFLQILGETPEEE